MMSDASLDKKHVEREQRLRRLVEIEPGRVDALNLVRLVSRSWRRMLSPRESSEPETPSLLARITAVLSFSVELSGHVRTTAWASMAGRKVILFLGPTLAPEEIDVGWVEDVVEEFFQVVVAAPFYWDRPAPRGKFFRRPGEQLDTDDPRLEEILRSARRSEAFNQEVLGAGVAQILTDLERLTAEVDDREMEKFLEAITPSPRLRRVVGKWLEDTSQGLIVTEDLKPR